MPLQWQPVPCSLQPRHLSPAPRLWLYAYTWLSDTCLLPFPRHRLFSKRAAKAQQRRHTPGQTCRILSEPAA
jgi:hypothetical protein